MTTAYRCITASRRLIFALGTFLFCLALTVHSVQRLANETVPSSNGSGQLASSEVHDDGAGVVKLSHHTDAQQSQQFPNHIDDIEVQKFEKAGDAAERHNAEQQFDIHAFAKNRHQENKTVIAGQSRENNDLLSAEAQEIRRSPTNRSITFFDNELNDGSNSSASAPASTGFGTSKLCPEQSPHLKGRLGQGVLVVDELKESSVADNHPELKMGGEWKPVECKARHKIALIVPFRDRQTHLTRLLDFVLPIFERQQLDFRIIVTEQYGSDLFNKGKLMNAAARLAAQMRVDCVIYHDVDMFPQDDRIPYGCPPKGVARHLGAFVNSLGYELWYDELVGGILVMNLVDLRRVNGFSNMYWAWGGEDDDMGLRLKAENITVERPDKSTARFTMLKHQKRQRTNKSLVYELLKTSDTRYVADGLDGDHLWTVMKVTKRPLYYHMYVDVGAPPDIWRSDTPVTASSPGVKPDEQHASTED